LDFWFQNNPSGIPAGQNIFSLVARLDEGPFLRDLTRFLCSKQEKLEFF
jgi:hypothetical protein